MKKMISLLLVLCLSLTLFTACGDTNPSGTNTEQPGTPSSPSAPETPPPIQTLEPVADEAGLVIRDTYLADKITLGSSGNCSSLVPHGRAVFGNFEVRNIIFQKLLRADNDGVIHNELAKSVEQLDELTYKITLWDCIYDSEGNPFTADDVIFSMDAYLATGNSGYVDKYESLEKVDEYTVIWHCKAPFGQGELGEQMSMANMLTQAAMEDSSDGMVTTPVGTGPYKLKSFTPGTVCVLEVDENFWMRNLPEDVRKELWIYNYQNVREIEIQCIRDASQRAIALERGTVIAVDNLDAIDLKAFESNPDISAAYMLNRPPLQFIFNCSDASPCSSIELRKAICYAIDNAAIAQGIGNYAFPVYAFQPCLIDSPEEWLTGREYYNYNPDTARELVAQSGYSGQTLTLMYGDSATGVDYEGIAVMMQSQLGKIGVNIDIKSVERAIAEVDRFDEDGWDMRLDIWGGGNYNAATWASFVTNAYPTDIPDKNIMLIKDTTLDELFEKMDADPTEANITAFDDYFNEQCYGYSVVGYYLQTGVRAGVNIALGDRGSLMVPNAFTFDESFAGS